MEELLAEFIAETREMLDASAGEIVAWEADPSDRDRLDTIFRFVHTVKGSSGFLDLESIQRISHEAESVLSDLREEKREPTPELVSAILAVIDRIGVKVDSLEQGEDDNQALDDDLIAVLKAGGDAAAATITAPTPHRRAKQHSIRVPVELLDRLMSGVSDLVLARNELSRQLRGATASHRLDTAFERMSGCIADLRDSITWTRMQRIESLFAQLPRLVRDLSIELGKSVSLEIDGADVELDREMIEMLRDPLTHIVRNALDHGIESPEERRRAGKNLNGTLRVSARQSGNQIHIMIGDDGRGIDRSALIARAVKQGLIEPAVADTLSDKRAHELIFHPGLTTASDVSDISGRGVGMDVVQSNVEHIGGAIEVESEAGVGAAISLHVPLTLTIIPALVVRVAEEQYAVPQACIDEIISLREGRAQIEQLGGTEIARVRGKRIPVVRLTEFLGHDRQTEETAEELVIVRSSRSECFALVVSAALDHEELVVKPAAPGIMSCGIYGGTALPDNGRPVLLLDVSGIANAAGLRLAMAHTTQAAAVSDRAASAVSALVFDDLDGCRRALAMNCIDRMVDVPVDTIVESGGARRVTFDGKLDTVITKGPLPDSGSVRLLKMSGDTGSIAYAILTDASDVTELPDSFDEAPDVDGIAGITVIDGVPVELLDVPFLLAQGAAPKNQNVTRPRCLVLGAEGGWQTEMLAPLVALAGYDVSFDPEDQLDADCIIDVSGTGAADQSEKAKVVRLSAHPGPDENHIYQYDRAAIFDVLQRKMTVGN